jgi:Xaa-Pro aminopeptidase
VSGCVRSRQLNVQSVTNLEHPLREPPPPIPPEEFGERRRRAAAATKDRGLRGLLIWSRGGTAADWYGDVLYLANFVTPIPQIHDTAVWSARGHAALILPVEDEPTLIVDAPDFSPYEVQVDDVRPTTHIIEETVSVLIEKGLDRGGLGIVGQQSLLLANYRGFERALGRPLEGLPADDLVAGLRRIKSENELNLMRHAAAVGEAWMIAMLDSAEPGRTEGEIVGEGLRKLAALGSFPYDVAVGSGPTSYRYQRVAMPSWDATRPLERGDLLHIDAWGPVNGYYTDFARSTVIGGRPSLAQREVLEASIELVDHLIEAVKPGCCAGELHDRGTAWLSRNGFIDESAFGDLFPAFGHCLGLGHEEPWIVSGEQTELVPNMVIAIETFVSREKVGAAGFEQNLVVTENGHEILTTCRPRWWV